MLVRSSTLSFRASEVAIVKPNRRRRHCLLGSSNYYWLNVEGATEEMARICLGRIYYANGAELPDKPERRRRVLEALRTLVLCYAE